MKDIASERRRYFFCAINECPQCKLDCILRAERTVTEESLLPKCAISEYKYKETV